MSVGRSTTAPVQHADRFFIGGEWVAPSSDATVDVIDSGTEDVYYTIAAAAPDDMARAIRAARDAFDGGPWARLTQRRRAEYITALHGGAQVGAGSARGGVRVRGDGRADRASSRRAERRHRRREVSELLVTNPAVDKITFTGSTAAGRRIASLCGERIACMSFHDVDDLDGAVHEAARVLRPGGRLCVAMVHPFASAQDLATLHTPEPTISEPYLRARRYRDEVEHDGLAMTFESMHRPLGAYVASFAGAGFVLDSLREYGMKLVPWLLVARLVKVV